MYGSSGRHGGLRVAVGTGRGAVAALLAVSLATVGTAARGWWADPSSRVGGGTQLEAFGTWMSRHDSGAQIIWAERHAALDPGIYRNGPLGEIAWHQQLQVAEPAGELPAPGDLVLLPEKGRVCEVCRGGARQVRSDPPRPLPGWRQVFATRDGVVGLYSAG